jgi:hypothetical protein
MMLILKNKDGKFETSNTAVQNWQKIIQVTDILCQRFNSNGQEFLRIER